MAIHGPAPGFKGRTFELQDLNSRVFNFCICSTPMQGDGQNLNTERQILMMDDLITDRHVLTIEEQSLNTDG